MTLDFNVEALEPVRLIGPAELCGRDLMSPFVWSDANGKLGIMVRAVPTADMKHSDTGIIWGGWSSDGGASFEMLDTPVIVPGPDDVDAGGVEDPTVEPMPDGSYIVYYSAVAADQAHSNLSYAQGPSIDKLSKSGIALASTKSMGNTKEATVGHTANGQWRLFYEYAADEASRVGLAIGPGVAGPWEEEPAPFTIRENSWDDWHLSTGPILRDEPDTPVMFYNGATRDARWRIGWVAFDADVTKVIARGLQPLVTPPPADDRGATDIAFAASVIVDSGKTWLYYSLEDRKLARALIRRS